jgi:hypothetical protein
MRPPTAAKITISIEGTMPTKRRRHEADLQREHRAADPADSIAARQKAKTLNIDTS